MSIIPNPGPRPNVTPTEEFVFIGAEHTVTAGTTIYQTADSAVFRGFNSTLINNGTIWLENSSPQAWLITGGRSNVENSGSIYIHGQSQVALSPEIENFVNTGSVFVISDSGWARGVEGGAYGLTADNSGLLAVQSLGLDPTQQEFWNATAIDTNTLVLTNRAGGQILAESVNYSVAVATQGSGWDAPPVVTNHGLISANTTAVDGLSIGIYLYQPGYQPQTIINSGTIRGDYAILATYSSETVRNPQEIVQNLAGGVLEGEVFLDIGDDQMVNAGRVIGNVDMGDGADIFSGNGSVTGIVDLGFGTDTYTGSNGADRAVGGRGDDSLSGRGGNDLLIGGFGDDILSGDAGNDGLIGEWGDDTISTQGGDYVEGNSGNDRIVLGDYTFEQAHGGTGFDVLAMANGARNFSLAQMIVGGRITSFEAIELQGGQQLAIDATSIGELVGGGAPLWVDATATDTVHLSGNWARGANETFDGVLYEVWRQGQTTVLVTEAATVTANSAPAFGGFDAVASGAAAFRPGTAAGLAYTDEATFLHRHLISGTEFIVQEEEVFYSSGGAVFAPQTAAALINDGRIFSLDDRFPSSIGIDFTQGGRQLINNGLILTEQLAEFDSVFYYASFGIRMGGGPDALPLENFGEISVYSVPGSAIAVHNAANLINDGTISAISEHSRAIGVNAVYGSHIVEYYQTFFNTGTIYAEAGGPGRQVYVEGDRFVPEQYVATGVASWGSLVNDGQIIAILGANAAPDLQTVGVYAMNLYGNAQAPANVTNNGTIIGTNAIVFDDYSAGTTNHSVFNNGFIFGDVQFLEGDDTYDGRLGEIVGTVYGWGGADNLIGGNFADTFNGGRGNDIVNGGGNIDTAIVTGRQASYTITQTSTGVFQVVGLDGTDTLTAIEYLQFDDATLRLMPGSGTSVIFQTTNTSIYQAAMNNIRDFDGNALGGDGSWVRIGAADVNGDGDIDQILVNGAIGRFATVGTAADGLVYFDDYGWAGETRVAGTYIDPLVSAGEVVSGSDNDSQRRFQNDLSINNISEVLGGNDYDSDGLQEVYFALNDGTAYLHAYMHADGNIQYANYQSQQQVIDYLSANGFGAETYGDWFASQNAQEVSPDDKNAIISGAGSLNIEAFYADGEFWTSNGGGYWGADIYATNAVSHFANEPENHAFDPFIADHFMTETYSEAFA